MVLEGLGVAEHHEPLNGATWHLFRLWQYDTGEKKIRHPGSPGPHQDTNALSVVCQHEVEGLEVRTRGGEDPRHAVVADVARRHGRQRAPGTYRCTSAGFLLSLDRAGTFWDTDHSSFNCDIVR